MEIPMADDPMSALISGGLSMAGGLMGNLFSGARQQQAQDFNAQQVQQMEQFQTQMSNTAYQRSMRDMQAAGLNPILAYARGGASAPSGGAATSPSPQSFSDVLTPAVNSALATEKLSSDMALQKEQILQMGNTGDLTKKRSLESIANANNTDADTANKLLQSHVLAADAAKGDIDKDTFLNPLYRMVRQISVGSQEGARALSLPSSALDLLKPFKTSTAPAPFADRFAGTALPRNSALDYARRNSSMDPANVYPSDEQGVVR